MIKVIETGFFTTLQDQGRWGFRSRGVPLCGPMDQISSRWANLLLGNLPGAAVLEITMTGPELVFQRTSQIAITGADMSAEINLKPVPMYQVIEVAPGDVLKFGRLKEGFRTYLAVEGGFKAPKVLDSMSWYGPVTLRSSLKKGDVLQFGSPEGSSEKLPLSPKLRWNEYHLEVSPGPEFNLLTKGQKSQLFKTEFTVSKENNRMAYQLKEPFHKHEFSMLTSATLPGTVQWTPSGKLIILMRDAQTTGGYPRILQLSDASISLLAQKKTSDRLAFKLET